MAGLALPAQTAAPPVVDDTLRRLVEALDPNPAFVANPWWDLLAYNQAYSALHGGLDARPAAERNVLWLFFATDPARYLIKLDQARQVVVIARLAVPRRSRVDAPRSGRSARRQPRGRCRSATPRRR